MKQFFIFLIALLLLPSFGYGQQECSVNPGGDQNICLGDQMTLYGEESDTYLSPLDAQWTASSSNPIPVIIDDANVLETKVFPDASQGYTDFVNGNYKFELCVICDNHVEACQSVNIYVGEIVNPPVIAQSDMTVCSGQPFTLNGSTPDPGVTATWFTSQFAGSKTENGTDITIDHAGGNSCDITVKYLQSIGGCDSEDEVIITVVKEITDVTADVVFPSTCPSCSRRIQVAGSPSGCNLSYQWWVISTPMGIIPTDVTIESPTNAQTWIEVPANGDYTFGFAADSELCGEGETTLSCTINEIPAFGLEPSEGYIYCSEVWDISSLFLQDPGFAGANYEWSVNSSTISNHGITFTDPTSNATTVNFNNAPMDVAPAGWNFGIKLTMTLGDCVAEKSYVFGVIPAISIINETVNLLCGGDPMFKINSNLNNSIMVSSISAKVASSPSLPVGFEFSATSAIDLTTPGLHCFDLTWEETGDDVLTGLNTTCFSTNQFCVNVAEVPTIDCGSAIETCLSTAQLNGNTPLDQDGTPLDIPVYWVQTGGPTVTLVNADTPDPFVTGLENGNVYTFQYVISEEPDCMISCENTITVLPVESCSEPCEISAQVGECLDGCVQVNLSGADYYTWSPSAGVDDSDPNNPIICSTESTTYLVTGFVDGESCESFLLDIPGCENTTLDCNFVLEKNCTFCGCGDPVGGASLYDADGNYVNVAESGISLEWIIDGEIVSEGHNGYAPHYIDPYVLCAHVSFTQSDGTACDMTMCVDVTCHGDCPEVTFATCADAPFSDYPECADYNPANTCFPGGFAGYVWALDQAGNPIKDFNINFPGYGTDNPTYINTIGSSGCSSIPFEIDHPGGCDESYTFSPDCCSQLAPEIDCAGFDKDCWRIDFDEICGTETYVFTVTCFNDLETTTYELDASTVGNTGSICIPIPKGCDYFQVSMEAICTSGNKGPASNCIIIDVRAGECFTYRDPCDLGRGRYQSQTAEWNRTDNTLLYPNPNSDGTFYYQHNFDLEKVDQILSMEILDLTGRTVYTTSIANDHSAQEFTSSLPNGLYLLNVRDENGQLFDSKRLIITKY